MNRYAKYLDFFFLGLLGTLIIRSIIGHFDSGFVLSINTYMGIVCWLASIILTFKDIRSKQFFVVSLLSLSTLNIISFTSEAIVLGKGGLFEWGGFYFTKPSIKPLFFILLFFYVLLNRRIGKQFYAKLFLPSDLELEKEYEKKIKFYYQMFSSCSSDELNQIVQNIKDYPQEAQDALRKIQLKKTL